MAKNIKTSTIGKRPNRADQSGWAPMDSQARLNSQLDAATGRLTGDQKRYFADLPSEEFSNQPSTGHKIIQTGDGAAEYHQLVSHGGTWRDPSTGVLFVNSAVRP